MVERPGLGKRPSSNDRGVSPPTSKRKQQSTTTSKPCANTQVTCADLDTRQSSCELLYPALEEGARKDDMAHREGQSSHRSVRCIKRTTGSERQDKDSCVRFRKTEC
jgi:hypothetical protein